MPIIQVNLIEGRPKEKITEVIENITNTVAAKFWMPRPKQYGFWSMRFLLPIGEKQGSLSPKIKNNKQICFLKVRVIDFNSLIFEGSKGALAGAFVNF